MAPRRLVFLLLVALPASWAYGGPEDAQGVLVDKERLRAACPDYKAYSTYGQ
jgi:hypothetical protein